MCRCDWVVSFKFLNLKTYTLSDSAKILHVCGIHTNTCYPTFLDQYVVARTHSGEYQNVLSLFYRKQCIKCILIRKLILRL